MSTDRIHLPGPGQPLRPDPNQPVLIHCPHCGWVILLPAQLAQVAAGKHDMACIGPRVARILSLLEHLEPPNREHTFDE